MTKEYHKKWQQENKDKVNSYSRNYYHRHKEKVKEIQNKWRKNNPDKAKANDKRSHQRFIETHNWSEYVTERKKARVEKLREQGVKNPWSVLNGREAKYE